MKKCIVCKKLITKYSKLGYCKSCSNKFAHPKRKNHYCIDCGKEKSKIGKRCSSCRTNFLWDNKIYKNRDFSGKNNPMFGIHRFGKESPNWQNGISFEEYPIEFTDQLKESIRQRDNYECQNCGMTEEEHLIVNGQVLHIHHIDYNKENCSLENLITTCQQCNLRANSNRDYWKEFYTNKIMEIIHV
jgi:predicted RNA-binding Zn-ribbon protein involved in translation (DUF1610 family)